MNRRESAVIFMLFSITGLKFNTYFHYYFGIELFAQFSILDIVSLIDWKQSSDRSKNDSNNDLDWPHFRIDSGQIYQ